MAQNDIGSDIGTTTIIIAQEGTGVVLNQPSVVAVDTRKNSVLEVGDKALAMVGRTPNYISAIFPLKDGVISDHTMTRELICRFVNQVYSSHMVKPRVAVCVPAAITGIDSGIYEAAVIDGASTWKRIWYVTLPLLMPTVCILTLMSIGRIFYGDFAMYYAIVKDNGILLKTTDVIDTYVFRMLRTTGNPSMAMAIGVYQSVMGFLMVFGANWFTKKFFPEGALF